MRKKATHPVRRTMSTERLGVAPLWTIEDVAAYMQTSTGTIRGFIFRRAIPHFKCGRLIRFRQADIERWNEENQRACK